MSNFKNSIVNSNNKKYSLDEIEISENNATYNDSLHKEKINNKEIINELKHKMANYYLALNTIQKNANDTFQELSLNEFSKSNIINTKDKNIINYIKNPLKKEIFKIGNILKIIKTPKINKRIITLDNKNKNRILNINNPSISEIDEENSSTIINETKSITTSKKDKNKKINNYINNNINNDISNNKNIIKEYNNNFISNKIKNNANNYKNNINNIANNLDSINDLEEPIDIKIKKNNVQKEKLLSNNIKPNQIINQYIDLGPNKFIKEKNGIFNSRIIKSLDFRNIRKKGFNYSIHDIKHLKKWSNVDIILKNKTKTTTGKKLRKKYERSELKTNKYESNSLKKKNNIRYYNSSINNIYIKENVQNEEIKNNFVNNEKLAKNLIGKFNMCSQGDDLLDNMMMFNINEQSKNESKNERDDINNDNLDFIDFLSNESGIYKQNNNIVSKDYSNNNNDTFIIKTNDKNIDIDNEYGTSSIIKHKNISDNKQRKNSYNLTYSNNIFNTNMNKSNENYNSPIKLKEFQLLPLKNKNQKRFNNQKEISILKRDQNKMNIIPLDQEQYEFLDLSDSPSYINTQSPKNIPNSSDKISFNDNYILENNNNNQIQTQQHSIYDLDFYQNLLLVNKGYKKINFQKIFKNQPLINFEERLNTLLWMMKICEEFAFKRETYHFSCFYFDLYLFLTTEKIKNKNELKLIGITCISISAKIEEVQIPKLVEYAESIDDSYKIEDIINTEKNICRALGWKLIPMTLSSWLNWYTCQWDLFIYSIDGIKDKLLLFTDDDNILFFKRQNEISFYNYRRIYQIIDLISLDYHNYKYEIRYLIAASFLVSICLHYNLEYDFNKKILKKKNNIKNNDKKDIGKILMNIYIQFIEQSFDYSFEDKKLCDSIHYVYKFINFKFSYDIPLIFQVHQEHINECSYEDFISYQTTSENISPFFKEMNKKEIKKNKNKRTINRNLPINLKNKSKSSFTKQSVVKTTKKSFSSRKSSLTKDNSKNKISNY